MGKIEDVNIDQWSQFVSAKTRKWRNERNKVRGPESSVAKLGDYDLKTHTATFMTEPTYSGSAEAYENGATSPSRENMYLMDVQFVDMEKILSNRFSGKGERAPEKKSWENVTLAMFRGMIREAEIKFNCSCAAFLWQGHRYQLSQVDSAIHKISIPDPIWGPRHNGDGGLCKHLMGLSRSIRFFTPVILKEIRRKAR
jgi:hypothetical protein